MNVVEEAPWSCKLLAEGEAWVLSVVCGAVALSEIEFALAAESTLDIVPVMFYKGPRTPAYASKRRRGGRCCLDMCIDFNRATRNVRPVARAGPC